MSEAVSITISRQENKFVPCKVGDRIRLKKSSYEMFPVRIKRKQMVARLMKKKFIPYFKVTFADVDNLYPHHFTAHLKPHNF
jgi:hypothetical protein